MDDRAWGRLHEEHRSRVYGLCYRILGHAEEAEDACGETLLRAHKSRSQYDPARPFAQWILTIASRVSIDRIRRRSLERRIFEPIDEVAAGWEPAGLDADPLSTTLTSERRAALRSAIVELDDRDRAVLTMKYFADLSYDEIGEALGLNRAHVGTLIFRAKKRLRRSLNPRDADTGGGDVR